MSGNVIGFGLILVGMLWREAILEPLVRLSNRARAAGRTTYVSKHRARQDDKRLSL